MTGEKPGLEEAIKNARDLLKVRLQDLSAQETDARNEYDRLVDVGFEEAFAELVTDLRERNREYTLKNRQHNGDLEKAKEELKALSKKQITTIINEGYDIGKQLQKRKQELEDLVKSTKVGRIISANPIEIPVRVSRRKLDNNAEVLSVFYPISSGGFLHEFEGIVGGILDDIISTEYCGGKTKQEVAHPSRSKDASSEKRMLEVSGHYNIQEIIDNKITGTDIDKANISVKVYEDITGKEMAWNPLDMGQAAEALGITYAALAQRVRGNPELAEKTYRIKGKIYFPPETMDSLRGYKGKRRGRKKKETTGEEPETGIPEPEAPPEPKAPDEELPIEDIAEEETPAEPVVKKPAVQETEDGALMIEGKEVYRKSYAVELLGKSPASIDRMLNTKKLDFVKDSGTLYITRESLENHIEIPERISSPVEAAKPATHPGEGDAPSTHREKQDLLGKYLMEGLNVDEAAKAVGMAPILAKKQARRMGAFTKKLIESKYSSISTIRDEKIPNYEFREDRREIRDSILEKIADELVNPSNLSVLSSLEGPNFMTYIDIARNFGVNAGKSIIAEEGDKEYLAMKSFANNHKLIEGGEVLNGLDICHGSLWETVNSLSSGEYSFDIANLDYDTVMGGEVLKTAGNLFDKKLLAKSSMLFITLKDEDDRAPLINAQIQRYAREGGYRVSASGKKNCEIRGNPMIHLSYKITKAG